ncbi:TIGR01777 family oxidoreductase [Propionibacteriaceae bacterium Y2011]
MPEFVRQTRLEHPRDEVFAWHTRPGALTRLTAPGPGSARREVPALVAGETADLVVAGVPGTGGAVGFAWRARTVEVVAPESFTDVMESGPMASWHHRHQFDDVDGGTLITDTITYEPPTRLLPRETVESQLHRLWDFRARQLVDDLAFHATHREPRTIAVTGASGLVGRQLTALLGGGGHRVVRLVRGGTTGDDTIGWDPSRGELDPEALRGVDVVVHLGGEPIGRPFTAGHKRRVLSSRVDSTRLLAEALAELAADGRDRAFVVASAAGWYGAAASTGQDAPALTEDEPAADDFLGRVCRAWEAAADPAREAGVRTVHVRTGIVQSAGGGPLMLQWPLFLAGLGGALGRGDNWLSWITLDDLVRLYAHVALTDGLAGPVNAVAPNPVTGQDHSRAVARVLRRPSVVRVPPVALAAMLGPEGAQQLALASQRLSADRALSWGVRFSHPDLRRGLAHVLCR